MPFIHNGVEQISGTYLGGSYALVIVHRDINPNLHIAVHYESSTKDIRSIIKSQNAVIATEGIFWDGGSTPIPYGDVLANGINHRGRLSLKRYTFGVTNTDCYLVQPTDVLGFLQTGKTKYGIHQNTISKHHLKHGLGGIVGLIRDSKPIPLKFMGGFSEKSMYILTGKQFRIGFAWTRDYKKFFMFGSVGRTSKWTAEELRDFFSSELPKIKSSYRPVGAVMPDTGSYTYMFRRSGNAVIPVTKGAGPSGVQQDRFQNISFVLVKDVS